MTWKFGSQVTVSLDAIETGKGEVLHVILEMIFALTETYTLIVIYENIFFNIYIP